MSKPIQMEKGVKYRDADKMALIPVKNMPTEQKEILRKPEWMKIKLPADSQRIQDIKSAMRKNNLHSVCEEAGQGGCTSIRHRHRPIDNGRRTLCDRAWRHRCRC